MTSAEWIWFIPICSALLLYLLFKPRGNLNHSKNLAAEAASVIVPARNEEKSLPELLESIAPQPLLERIVVNDSSTDRTPDIALSFGAKLVQAPPLPGPEWTGKNWACHVGAQAATANTLVFLDADTRFEAGGLEKILSYVNSHQGGLALSVLPYYISKKFYEELSAFFMIAMALGSGSFARGALKKSRLFGQSLFVNRRSYEQVGGHEIVRSKILENLFLSDEFHKKGIAVEALLGQGMLRVRMFPDGVGQLVESWTKAFVRGAGSTPGPLLALIIIWMVGLFLVPLLALLKIGLGLNLSPLAIGGSYALLVLQLYWLLRKLGNFSFFTSLFYTLPLIFYQVVFFSVLKRILFKQQVEWRGRSLASK